MGLKNFSKNISYAAMGLALMMGISSAQAEEDQPVIVTLVDGSTYSIMLKEHTGNMWTYHVEELSGKSLSHWVLGISNCVGTPLHVVSSSEPDGSEPGEVVSPDPTTGITGYKWDLQDDFEAGDFTIILDQDYPTVMIDVAAKAGSPNNTGFAQIEGPNCNEPPDVPDALAISLSDLNIRGNTVRWRTDLEHNNAGYHVWVRCPRVAAAGPSDYEFKLEDCTAVEGIVLEDIDNTGRSSFHLDLMNLD
jgi:hypothetical protein